MIRTQRAPACHLCGHAGETLYTGVCDRSLFIPGSWSFRLCGKCGLAWLDPQPIPEDIPQAYDRGYYTHSRAAANIALGRNPLMRALRGAILSSRYGYSALRPKVPLANAIGWLLSLAPPLQRRATLGWSRAVPPFQSNGRLLEIGCGDGNYLAAMRLLGWEVHGVEPDQNAAERAAAVSGAKIWPGGIETAQFPRAEFSAVVSLHSIEHVCDPRLFMERAARALRPGGFLYVVTPNFQSLARRAFKSDWYALDVPRHLNLFTPKSLRLACESGGLFRVQSVRTLTRRARREREHIYALHQTGSFHGEFTPGCLQRLNLGLFSSTEKLGEPLFRWGEEIELIARRR